MFRQTRFIPKAGDEFLSFHEQIEKRAYAIYLARGREHGYDLDDWLAAEQELECELGAGLLLLGTAA